MSLLYVMRVWRLFSIACFLVTFTLAGISSYVEVRGLCSFHAAINSLDPKLIAILLSAWVMFGSIYANTEFALRRTLKHLKDMSKSELLKGNLSVLFIIIASCVLSLAASTLSVVSILHNMAACRSM